jgi:hypothetical protein
MQGHVYHSRSETAKNSFKYPIFNIYFSLSSLDPLRLMFKKNFKNTLSIKDQDYFPSGTDHSLADKCTNFLKSKFDYQPESIYLQSIPRMFGYAFNPINFWYCYRQEKLEAVLCEVNNTFGETHYYWLYQDGQDLRNQWLIANKQFHVSPFFAIEGHYRFRFRPEVNSLHVDIHYLNADGTLKLNTWVQGSLTSLEEISIIKLIWQYGWITPLVVFRIHYQALKLFFKKVKFFKKPNPPAKEITNGTTNAGH